MALNMLILNTPRSHVRTLFLIPTALICCALAACSGNKSSSRETPKQPVKVLGTLGAGNMSAASIQAIQTDAQGQLKNELKGTKLVFVGKTAKVDGTSSFKISVDNSAIGQPVILNATSKGEAGFRCELVEGCGDTPYLNTKTFPHTEGSSDNFELRSAIGEALNNVTLNVNWITNLANAYAYTSYIKNASDVLLPRAGIYNRYTIESANEQVSKLFDLPDIISLTPTSPSKLSTVSRLKAAAREPSIRYGALLAGVQRLVAQADTSYMAWQKALVSDVLDRQGFFNKGGSDHASLFAIYDAAVHVLETNIGQQATTPSEASAALAALKSKRDGFVDGEETKLSKRYEPKSGGSLAAIDQAKAFIKDLNQRLVNFAGKKPNTCGTTGADDSTCMPSFVDPKYVSQLETHYNALGQDFDGVKDDAENAIETLRDLSHYYISCLQGDNTCNSMDYPTVHSNATYNKTDRSLTHTSAGKTIKLTFEPFKRDGVIREFNIFFLGAIGPITFKTFKVSGSNESVTPSLRLVYENKQSLPQVYPKNSGDAGVQPLGYDFNLGGMSINTAHQPFDIYLTAKLIGVKDPVVSNSRFHYNFTQISMVTNIEGEQEVLNEPITVDGKSVSSLSDKTELVVSGSTFLGGGFRSETEWPTFDDFFTVRSDAKKDSVDVGLFTYKRGTENVTFENKPATVDYVDFTAKGMPTNRYRFYEVPENKEAFGLQVCIVSSGQAKGCQGVQLVKGDASVQNFFDELSKKVFLVVSRGAYQVKFPLADGKVDLGAMGNSGTLDGKLVSPFTQGISELNVRLGHELVDEGKPIAPAILDIKTKRLEKDAWQVTATFGYDYTTPVISMIPVGKRAQSVYVSYVAGGDNNTKRFYELGSFLVYRGGVTLFSDKDGGESIGLSGVSTVKYEGGSDDKGCGVQHKDKAVAASGTCSAVAYVAFRNSLMAVIREERPNVYVARFIDGSFIILGD